MDKKTYYISVGSGEILEPEDMTGNFEFEILATEEEIDKLQELFEDKEFDDDMTSIRAHVPFVEYHNDIENDAYDWTLTEIYKMIHQLGTPDTRKHIETMKVLPQ